MLNEDLVFESFEPIKVPVTIGKIKYELREADAAGAKAYRIANLTGVEMEMDDEKGTKTVKKLAGAMAVEALLVSLCLFENKGPEIDDKGTILGPDRFMPVPLMVVNCWKNSLVKKLHDRAKVISELDERDDLPTLEKSLAALQRRIDKLRGDQAKNGSGAGQTSSASPTN